MQIEELPFEPTFLKIMERESELVWSKAETQIVEDGKYIRTVPLLLKGSIRVFQQDYDLDREILLYYVNPGETCMMSLGACFGDKQSKVNAITETDSTILMLPTDKVRAWQREFTTWNTFVIETFRDRYMDLLQAFNDVSFRKIEERLHTYLRRYRERHNTSLVTLTHLDLARELGTTRVVISRLLKAMERSGEVRLQRNAIELSGLWH